MKQETYRKVVVPKHGPPDVMQVDEDVVPQPGPDEIRVRTLAAGISGMDLMVRRHRFPGFPKVPFTPGVDVVGVVEALGKGVTDLEVGDTVAALLGDQGGYAEMLCIPAEIAVPLPVGTNATEAAATVTNYLTAYAMLHRAAEVKSGEKALVQGAAGGVGTALLELGAQAGLELYGTASPHNLQVVSDHDATPIDYHRGNVAKQVRAMADGGVDVVFDPIGGGRQLWNSYRALRKGGRLVWFGVAGSSRHGVSVIPASLLTRLAIALIPDGRSAPMPPDASKPNEWYRETLATLLDYLAAGKIEPVIAERFPLLEAASAHEFMEQRRYAGKVVLISKG